MRLSQIAGSTVSLLAGLLGGLACAGAMILAGLGIVSAGAAQGMAEMEAPEAAAGPSGVGGFLIREGAPILLASIALVTLSLLVRRRSAVLPAIAAGALLYWGMYGQDRLWLMAATIVLGLGIWLALALWVRGVLPRGAGGMSSIDDVPMNVMLEKRGNNNGED